MRSLTEYREMVERALPEQMKRLDNTPERLVDAMLYSLMAGGKRLRPVLLTAACEAAGGNVQEALPFACAIEMIHTYSLIHDDLPAMDNDDLRRGKPTNHRVYGEAMAILAGDGLLSAAFEIMLDAAWWRGDRRGIAAALAIARRCGVQGMVAGQTLDMDEDEKTLEDLRETHLRKCADLLTAPMETGMYLAGAPDELLAAGRTYGLHLGLAFQIADDLLDVLAAESDIGKQVQHDAETGKKTWVTFRGVEGSMQDLREEIGTAVAALQPLGENAAVFAEIAEGVWRSVADLAGRGTE